MDTNGWSVVRMAASRQINERGGRSLTTCHAGDFVVQHHAGEIEIAPEGVDQVIAADREAVAVAGDHDHLQVRARELETCGAGERPAMGNVKGVSTI